MNHRLFKERLTFLLIPEPNRQVRRFHLPALLLYLLPLAAAGLIAGLAFLAAGRSSIVQENIALKEERLSGLEQLASDLAEKEQIISSLQDEMVRLSQEAEKFAERLAQLQTLEQELLSMTKAGQLHVSEAKTEPAVSRNGQESAALGGEYVPLTSEDLLALAQETIAKYEAFTEEVGRLETSLARALAEAEQTAYLQSITPSIYPTLSNRVTSAFGYRKDPFTKRNAYHKGIDFGGNPGDPVFATAAGTVKRSGYDKAMGHYIFIEHGNGLETAYMHLSKRLVTDGQTVRKGETIGLLGSTGRSTGPHLHYEVHRNSKPVNPKLYITDEKG